MPQNIWAYEILANCYCDLEMHKERVAVLTKALYLEPKNGGTFYARCYSHLQLKEYDAAIKDAKSVLKLVPPDHVFAGLAYWRLAEAQYKLGSLDQSIASCNKALDLYESPEIYELRSLAREKKGEVVLAMMDRVLAQLEEYRSRGPFLISSPTIRLRNYFAENKRV